jgi:hypothetical protein
MRLLRCTAATLLFAFGSMSWAADTPVSPAGRLAGSPDVAAGADGRVYVAWVDRGAASTEHGAGHGGAPGAPRSHASSVDVWVAASKDGGATFGEPVRVNDRPGQVWSFPTSRPRIAVGPRGTLHVLFTGNDVNASGKPVLVPMYARSTDGGRTFEPARRLASPADTDLSEVIHGGYAQAQTFGTLVVDGRGGVHVYWIDTRFMRGASDTGALLALHSTDDGRTFGSEQVLAKTGACPCCQITAAAADAKRVFLGARLAEDGYRDSTVLASYDAGRTFRAPVRLGDARWKLDGCPLKPTAVGVDGTHVYAAAFNAASDPSGVRFAASADGGRTFGAFREIHPGAAVSDYPSVVALPKSRVQVFWHAKVAGEPARAVYGAESRDGGATFAPPAKLVTGAAVGYPSATRLRDGDVALAYVADDRVQLRRMASVGNAP